MSVDTVDILIPSSVGTPPTRPFSHLYLCTTDAFVVFLSSAVPLGVRSMIFPIAGSKPKTWCLAVVTFYTTVLHGLSHAGSQAPMASVACHARRELSSIDGKVQAEIMERCNELHASFIQPLNDNVHGPLEKLNTGGYQSTKMPFVFVLGNHSSGKSSFINYVLGRNIQTAGVAPTDDRCIALL